MWPHKKSLTESGQGLEEDHVWSSSLPIHLYTQVSSRNFSYVYRILTACASSCWKMVVFIWFNLEINKNQDLDSGLVEKKNGLIKLWTSNRTPGINLWLVSLVMLLFLRLCTPNAVNIPNYVECCVIWKVNRHANNICLIVHLSFYQLIEIQPDFIILFL